MEVATTWAEKRTMLRNISNVGTFVRKSMQEYCVTTKCCWLSKQEYKIAVVWHKQAQKVFG